VVVVVVDGAPAGLIAVRDEPWFDAAEGIRMLRDMGVRSVMLTGDNPRTARAIASVLGGEVHASLLPGDKPREIAALLGPPVRYPYGRSRRQHPHHPHQTDALRNKRGGSNQGEHRGPTGGNDQTVVPCASGAESGRNPCPGQRPASR
jgi:hypothetical protein